jgi:hypothetical protein
VDQDLPEERPRDRERRLQIERPREGLAPTAVVRRRGRSLVPGAQECFIFLISSVSSGTALKRSATSP